MELRSFFLASFFLVASHAAAPQGKQQLDERVLLNKTYPTSKFIQDFPILVKIMSLRLLCLNEPNST